MRLKNHVIFLSVSPLFFGTVACCAGIVAYSSHLSFLSLLKGHSSAYALLIASKLFFKKSDIIFIMILSTLLFWGAHERCRNVLEKQITLYQQLSQKTFDVYGSVTDLEHKNNTRFTTKVTLKLSSFVYQEKQRTCSTFLMINLLRAPSLQVGDLIFIKRLSLKTVYKKSFQEYLFKQGQVATLYLPTMNYHIEKRPSYSFSRWRWQQRKRLTERCTHLLSPTCALLFCTLFLGMKATHPHYKRIHSYFSYWGIVHYLSRSGLHLLIIGSLLHACLRFIPLHFFLKKLLLFLFLFMYYNISWPSIPFIRALSGLLLSQFLMLARIRVKALHTLSLITLIVLFVNPLHLFALDFQLSFGLTWALAWFNEATLVHRRKELSVA